jgi:DNA mismatch repair protein MutL
MTITVLAPQIANQIAAGEVVERPAAVVKELIENSFDASADSIIVDIANAGAKRILIRDNGRGITKDELGLALQRHATSKITNIDDLNELASMGFRGEALASIAAVSRLTLTSKTQNCDMAYSVSVDGIGQIPIITPSSHPNGTSIEVCDLFFNTPARRRFLRSEKTEFMQIEEVFRRLALSRNDVSMVLKHNGKLIYDLKKTTNEESAFRRLSQIMGSKFTHQSKKINESFSNMSLNGYMSLEHESKPMQYFFLNKRVVRDKIIGHAIKEAFNQVLDNNADVSYVLFLGMNPADVDINVHPQKFEVRFRESRNVHDFIQNVIINFLRGEQQVIPESFEETQNSKIDHKYGFFEKLDVKSKNIEKFIHVIDGLDVDKNIEPRIKSESILNQENLNTDGKCKANKALYQKMFGLKNHDRNIHSKIDSGEHFTVEENLKFLEREKYNINTSTEVENNLTDNENQLILNKELNSSADDASVSEVLSDEYFCPWLVSSEVDESLFKVLQIEDKFFALVYGVCELRLIDLRKLSSLIFYDFFKSNMDKYGFLSKSKLYANLELKADSDIESIIHIFEQLGFSIVFNNSAIVIESVPKILRNINLAKIFKVLCEKFDENIGNRAALDILINLVYQEKQPSYYSIDMAQRLVNKVHYVGYWSEKMPKESYLIQLNNLIKEHFYK